MFIFQNMSEIIKFQAIFHLSEIISVVTYEISLPTFPMLPAIRSVFGRTSSVARQMSVRKVHTAGKSPSRLDGRVAIVTASTEG